MKSKLNAIIRQILIIFTSVVTKFVKKESAVNRRVSSASSIFVTEIISLPFSFAADFCTF